MCRARLAVVLALAFVIGAPSASAQVRVSETLLLRDAANRESQGDFAGAEDVLRRILAEDPGSSGGLFALERVLRAMGRVVDVLPEVDRFLDRHPESSGVRYLKLRVLLEVDSLDALRAEAERWLESDPTSEVPYREVARVYERAYGIGEALDVLREGRAVIGNHDALALEIGDLLAARGDRDGAVDEWAVAVGPDAGQATTITRRIQGLTTGVADAGRRLVRTLAASDRVARRKAAARIALDLALGDEALRFAQAVAGELDGRTRSTFLADVARRARDHDLVAVASWAYDELGEDASSPAERRRFDQRIVDVALAAGDVEAALVAQRRVAASFSAGSVDRRRATAQVVRLEVAHSDPERLRGLLSDFRAEFPNAPELDDLAATVASALQARGDAAGASAVLVGIEGPKSSIEKAYLLLDEGEVERGRGTLLLALTGLPPSEATPVIQFVKLLGDVSPASAKLLAAAGVEAHRGDAPEAARALTAAISGLAQADRAPLLAEAARMASRGGADDLAADIRGRIVADHPDAPEVDEASLALARYHARTSSGVAEAIRLLEALITSRPNAAVVPDARLELEELRGRGR